MRKNVTFWIVLALAAVALVASASLLVDYVRPAPVFCGADGGCGVVKKTIFAYPLASLGLGIPMPAIGIVGLLGVALLSMIPGPRARLAQATLAVVGGLVAMGLVAVQYLLHALCPFCAVVDGAAILIGALSVVRMVKKSDPPASRRLVAGASVGLLLSVAIPVAVGSVKKPIPRVIPTAIAEELALSPAGKVTIIDFADFECPYCRKTHTELAPLLEEKKSYVRLVRKHIPLKMHPHALDAARAGCCAEKLGKGEAMADRLFTADTNSLTAEGCEKMAVELGLDVVAFRACVRDPSTDARLQADRHVFDEMVQAAGGRGGLPTLWVGREKLDGAQDRTTLRASLERAIREL